MKNQEVSYKREMNHNYMMIEGNPDRENSYVVKMLLSNSIEGLLRFSMKQTDAQCFFCYEITSRQPLGRLLESKSIQFRELRQMILGIAKALAGMEEYLLAEGQILLKPEFIYVEPDSFQVSLCLLPGEEGDFPQSLSQLLEYLLGHVDYQDKDAVVMAYGLYRESLKENYGMENLLGLLSARPQEESAPSQPMESRPVQLPEEGRNLWENQEKTEETPEIKVSKKFPIGMVLCVPVSLVLLWLLTGWSGLKSYGIVVIGAELCMAGLWILAGKRDRRESRAVRVQQEETMPWKMVFEEEEKIGEEAAEQIPELKPINGEDTVLLVENREKTMTHRLESLDSQIPNIQVAYYPFIIGKQENLADYIFRQDTVSRLHLRLDELDGTYRITDLNSTNGTSVNGRILEANESMVIKPGDQIGIAEYEFRFL